MRLSATKMKTRRKIEKKGHKTSVWTRVGLERQVVQQQGFRQALEPKSVKVTPHLASRSLNKMRRGNDSGYWWQSGNEERDGQGTASLRNAAISRKRQTSQKHTHWKPPCWFLVAGEAPVSKSGGKQQCNTLAPPRRRSLDVCAVLVTGDRW